MFVDFSPCVRSRFCCRCVITIAFFSCPHRHCRVDCRRPGPVVFRTEKTHMTQTYSPPKSTIAATSSRSEEVEYQVEAMSYRWTFIGEVLSIVLLSILFR